MIVIEGGYSVEEYPKQNKIVIGLPQTLSTCTNSVGQISNRRDVLDSKELSAIAFLVKTFYEMYNTIPYDAEQLKEKK